MERIEIESKVKEIINDVANWHEFTLEGDTVLSEVADSIDVVDIAAAIELEYNINIDDDTFFRMGKMTFREICDIVEKKVKSK